LPSSEVVGAVVAAGVPLTLFPAGMSVGRPKLGGTSIVIVVGWRDEDAASSAASWPAVGTGDADQA
jgi:hypothetical protein